MPERTTYTSSAPLQVAIEKDLFGAIGDGGDLLQALEKTHPQYRAHAELWRRMGDVALGRITTNADKRRYLIRGDAEEETHFRKRTELTVFLPETPGLVSDFVGAVFSKAARREFKQRVTGMSPAEELRAV